MRRKYAAIAGALCAIFCIPTAMAATYDTLVVGYYESPPFVMEHEEGLSGINVWLWERVCQETGEVYVTQKRPLDSLLSGLASGELDMSLNPLSITARRSRRIDFSAPYYISSSSVLVRAVTPVQKALQYVTSFFSLNFLRVLAALFVVISTFGILAWIFERRANPGEFGGGLKGIGSGIWWSAVTMTTVGYGDKSPRSIGGRIVALIWMFTAIILISGFTAGIASSLTVQSLAWNQERIDDFKEKKVATVGESATERFLQRNFFRRVISYKDLQSCIEALAHNEVRAVAYDEPLLQYVIREDSTRRFEILPITFNHQLYAFGFSEQVDAQRTEHISNEILEVTERADWREVLGEYGLSDK